MSFVEAQTSLQSDHGLANYSLHDSCLVFRRNMGGSRLIESLETQQALNSDLFVQLEGNFLPVSRPVDELLRFVVGAQSKVSFDDLQDNFFGGRGATAPQNQALSLAIQEAQVLRDGKGSIFLTGSYAGSSYGLAGDVIAEIVPFDDYPDMTYIRFSRGRSTQANDTAIGDDYNGDGEKEEPPHWQIEIDLASEVYDVYVGDELVSEGWDDLHRLILDYFLDHIGEGMTLSALQKHFMEEGNVTLSDTGRFRKTFESLRLALNGGPNLKNPQRIILERRRVGVYSEYTLDNVFISRVSGDKSELGL